MTFSCSGKCRSENESTEGKCGLCLQSVTLKVLFRKTTKISLVPPYCETKTISCTKCGASDEYWNTPGHDSIYAVCQSLLKGERDSHTDRTERALNLRVEACLSLIRWTLGNNQ